MSSYFDDFKQIKIFQLIILAGGAGAIYFLPYMRTSYYDVMIQGLKLTNTQLGQISSMYGLFTMICYFPGGGDCNGNCGNGWICTGCVYLDHCRKCP